MRKGISSQSFQSSWDSVVVGGGFFGCQIALMLSRELGQKSVLIVEREKDLMLRASARNQARVHAGYHYPRDLPTALSSRINHDRFSTEFSSAIVDDYVALYGIARRFSKVPPRAFVARMQRIGAQLDEPAPSDRALFKTDMVEAVFQARENLFDSNRLRDLMHSKLSDSGVSIMLDTKASGVSRLDSGLSVRLDSGNEPTFVQAFKVFNCTYAGFSSVSHPKIRAAGRLRHELAEMALLRVPPELQSRGITIMDGPFFSLLPNPITGVHSLSHVRYTPRETFFDRSVDDPYGIFSAFQFGDASDRMIRDAAKFVPAIARAKREGVISELKTVLDKTSETDSRPIFVDESQKFPGLTSILGAKIDNVFDVLDYLRQRLNHRLDSNWSRH